MREKSRKLLWNKSFIALFSIMLMILIFHVPAHSKGTSAEGQDIYEKYCIGCHGVKGDGNGKVASDLIIKPRDFTAGIYKFTSTPEGSLPSDDDLKTTIRKGLATSSMPAFKLLAEMEMDSLVTYLKTFSDKWKDATQVVSYTKSAVPAYVGTGDSINKGEKLYSSNCAMCHGTKSSRPDVTFTIKWDGDCNDWVKPANFNHGVIKRGKEVEDIYFSITAGVKNTPMVPFGNVISDENRWHLTSYVRDMMGKKRR